MYLSIRRQIDGKVQTALGRDAPHWRVLHGCPPCGYKVRIRAWSLAFVLMTSLQLQGEPVQIFGRMFCMDGNNSLKRMAPVGKRVVGDTRMFSDSDYYLPVEFVNRFANEVKTRQVPARPDLKARDEVSDDEDAAPPAPEGEAGGDPTDGASGEPTPCASNWKAAAVDEAKRSWAIFEETGIFVCACPHGFVLWLVDMIRSGELYVIRSAIRLFADESLQRKIPSSNGGESAGGIPRQLFGRL